MRTEDLLPKEFHELNIDYFLTKKVFGENGEIILDCRKANPLVNEQTILFHFTYLVRGSIK